MRLLRATRTIVICTAIAAVASSSGCKSISANGWKFEKTSHGKFVVDVGADKVVADTFQCELKVHYYTPKEVALVTDSLRIWRTDSQGLLQSFPDTSESVFVNDWNPAMSGPFALKRVGILRGTKRTVKGNLDYFFVLTVTTPSGDSTLEVIPVSGKMKVN